MQSFGWFWLSCEIWLFKIVNVKKRKRKKKEQAFNWEMQWLCSFIVFPSTDSSLSMGTLTQSDTTAPPFCMSSLFCPSILPPLSFLSTSLSLCLFLIFLYCLPLPPFFLSLVRVVFVWRTSSLWVFLLPLMIRSCDGKQELPCFRLLWGKPETESRLYHFS